MLAMTSVPPCASLWLVGASSPPTVPCYEVASVNLRLSTVIVLLSARSRNVAPPIIRAVRASGAGRREPEAAALEGVEQHCAQDHEAEDDLLGVALHPGEVHAVLDHGDDEGADEGAQDPALAAGEGGAAHHHRRDRVELVHEAVGGGAALELGGHDHAAEAGEGGGERVGE